MRSNSLLPNESPTFPCQNGLLLIKTTQCVPICLECVVVVFRELLAYGVRLFSVHSATLSPCTAITALKHTTSYELLTGRRFCTQLPTPADRHLHAPSNVTRKFVCRSLSHVINVNTDVVTADLCEGVLIQQEMQTTE